MEKYDNEVIDKFKELIEEIKNTDTYKNYILLNKKISKDEDIKTKIKKIKDLQKVCVKKESKNINCTKENEEIDNLLNELREYPIYLEYEYTVKDLNYITNYIKDSIESFLNENI